MQTSTVHYNIEVGVVGFLKTQFQPTGWIYTCITWMLCKLQELAYAEWSLSVHAVTPVGCNSCKIHVDGGCIEHLTCY